LKEIRYERQEQVGETGGGKERSCKRGEMLEETPILPRKKEKKVEVVVV
jgi:hypothetical protein